VKSYHWTRAFSAWRGSYVASLPQQSTRRPTLWPIEPDEGRQRDRGRPWRPQPSSASRRPNCKMIYHLSGRRRGLHEVAGSTRRLCEWNMKCVAATGRLPGGRRSRDHTKQGPCPAERPASRRGHPVTSLRLIRQRGLSTPAACRGKFHRPAGRRRTAAAKKRCARLAAQRSPARGACKAAAHAKAIARKRAHSGETVPGCSLSAAG
jgi:hypothetical protein